jgi:hypothetical protein
MTIAQDVKQWKMLLTSFAMKELMQMMSGRSLCTFVCLWMELVQIEPEIVEMITISLCK